MDDTDRLVNDRRYTIKRSPTTLYYRQDSDVGTASSTTRTYIIAVSVVQYKGEAAFYSLLYPHHPRCKDNQHIYFKGALMRTFIPKESSDDLLYYHADLLQRP